MERLKMIKCIDLQVDDNGNHIAFITYKDGKKQSYILDKTTNQIYKYLSPETKLCENIYGFGRIVYSIDFPIRGYFDLFNRAINTKPIDNIKQIEIYTSANNYSIYEFWYSNIRKLIHIGFYNGIVNNIGTKTHNYKPISERPIKNAIGININ